MKSWGRFTARGGSDVEARITALVSKVAETARRVLSPGQYRAMILIGGYGRGEGGVEIVDGEERPHNNLDFLALTHNLSSQDQSRLKKQLDEELLPLIQAYEIGMDVSFISASRLLHSPCLVMWYDMRFGHKTILGDEEFVPSLQRFSVDRIVPYDARNLMVNRGTLLVINELLLERGSLSEAEKKYFVKHVMKCVIGYGDALLFFSGAYDWSYQERQRRMRECKNADDGFRRTYDEAMEFRFQPNYSAFLGRDFTQWATDLRDQLAPIHLLCESQRLSSPSLSWDSYPQTAFRHGLMEEITSPRAVAKKIVNAVRSASCPVNSSPLAALGYRCLGARGRLPIFYPLIAYHLENGSYREWARHSLQASGSDIPNLRKAYLRQWSIYGDANFPTTIHKLNLTLDSEEAPV
jgi:hypothetical protein